MWCKVEFLLGEFDEFLRWKPSSGKTSQEKTDTAQTTLTSIPVKIQMERSSDHLIRPAKRPTQGMLRACVSP
jgi:hypothetical protein